MRISKNFVLSSDWLAFVDYKQVEVDHQLETSRKGLEETLREILLEMVLGLERETMSLHDAAALCVLLTDFIEDEALVELLLEGCLINESEMYWMISPGELIQGIRDYYC